MAEELALPITLLARTILSERRWPDCWREHLVHAILKKSSKSLGKNYRGVHLTAQLSKIVEKNYLHSIRPFAGIDRCVRATPVCLYEGKGLQGYVNHQCLQLANGFLVAV